MVVVVIDVVIVGIADDRQADRLGLAGADAVIAVSDEQTTSVDELQLRRSIEQRDTSSWESLTRSATVVAESERRRTFGQVPAAVPHAGRRWKARRRRAVASRGRPRCRT
jgi:hypothetical protein